MKFQLKFPKVPISFPEHIGQVVEFVQNIAMFVHKHKIRSSRDPRNVAPSEDMVVPETIYNLYNISHSLIIQTNSSQNVVEFSETAYQPSDLSEFVTGTGVQTPNNVTSVGSFVPSPPDAECTLDI